MQCKRTGLTERRDKTPNILKHQELQPSENAPEKKANSRSDYRQRGSIEMKMGRGYRRRRVGVYLGGGGGAPGFFTPVVS